MKKIVSMAVTCILILAMSLGVCAAPSVTKLPIAIATADESLKVNVKELSSQYTITARSLLSKVAEISEEEASTYEAISSFDLSAKETGEIKIYIAGLKKSDEVIVLHKCSVHDWEELPSKSGDGFVTATFHNYSPVVVFVKADAKSPKTADTGITTAVVVAAIAMTGLVIGKKKSLYR